METKMLTTQELTMVVSIVPLIDWGLVLTLCLIMEFFWKLWKHTKRFGQKSYEYQHKLPESLSKAYMQLKKVY
jgi:hypothetical protein